jgi:hypothetical protein
MLHAVRQAFTHDARGVAPEVRIVTNRTNL